MLFRSESTINVLLEVETAGGDIALIPAREDSIVEGDAGKKLLRAKLPEGLIDINDNN